MPPMYSKTSLRRSCTRNAKRSFVLKMMCVRMFVYVCPMRGLQVSAKGEESIQGCRESFAPKGAHRPSTLVHGLRPWLGSYAAPRLHGTKGRPHVVAPRLHGTKGTGTRGRSAATWDERHGPRGRSAATWDERHGHTWSLRGYAGRKARAHV